MQDHIEHIKAPLITNDAIVFGLLMLCLGFVFYTSSKKTGPYSQFYKYVPALFMAYMLPALLNTFGLIKPEWGEKDIIAETVEFKSGIYHVASRYLLPAALVLMTLSLDLKAVFKLGSKALIMFITGTVGIIIGGPIAILIVASVYPEAVGGAGATEVWKGLSTLAGSWIGGGANQTAMLEIYGYDKTLFGSMITVDVIVANLWMAVLLIGIAKNKKIDRWLKADDSSIERLKEKVSKFSEKVKRNPSLEDYMIIGAIAFVTVGLSHLASGFLAPFFKATFTHSSLTFLGSSFFWIISISTIIAIILSFTKARNYEGAGASKIGSLFIYILVVSIGMKIDLSKIMDNPGLIVIGLIWMLIHAILLIGVAKLIRAPYFFLAVGSQANVGGAASAPIVAAEFHPSLATVGVLLAVVGYAVGTVGAILCAELMHIVSP
jgi:uncharacterized membrane protein